MVTTKQEGGIFLQPPSFCEMHLFGNKMNPYFLRSSKALLFVFFIACFLMLSPAVHGEAYHPEGALQVLSEYRDSHSGPTRKVNWKVRSEDLATHWTLDFFLAGGHEPLCRLMLSHEKDKLKIEWQAHGVWKKTVFEEIMVMADFPVPCDILPIGTGENTGTFKTRREAGGSLFVTTYKVVRQEVGLQEAMRQGWIRAGVKAQGPFYFLNVLDSSGDMVLRQLWDNNGNWWLYEENVSGRRSWLLEGGE